MYNNTKCEWIFSDAKRWKHVLCYSTNKTNKYSSYLKVTHGSLHICPVSSAISSSRLMIFIFSSLIINPWETFFLPQQIKEGWVGRQGPDQLSQAAISTVLSLWHTGEIWALSKAERAISQASKAIFFHFTLQLPSTAHFLFPSYYPFIPISLHPFRLSFPLVL